MWEVSLARGKEKYHIPDLNFRDNFPKISSGSFCNIILIYLFEIVRRTEKFIHISKKEFTVYSMFVSNLSFIPPPRVFFVLSAQSWKKWHMQKNLKNVPTIESRAKMKNEKLRE